MVQVNVDTITAVNPKELSPEEKDDLFESIMWLEIQEDIPLDKYQPLFLITKEILKYKGEQVESLLADLDILASNADGGYEGERKELANLRVELEELKQEIQAKEKDLENERLQAEKFLMEINELQKDKADLRKEIIMIQAENQGGPPTSLNEESSEEINQLKELIQVKNKHILQLLSDIQISEKEAETLRTKLASIRQELSEATTNLTKLSGENISLRQANYEYQDKIATLEERNVGLNSQVTELVSDKNKREAKLDLLIDALEERVTKWQDILSQKDEEVSELRAKLNESLQCAGPRGSMQFSTNYADLTQTIEEQEVIIKRLHDQLKQATEDMSQSSVQVQELKEQVKPKNGEQSDPKKTDQLKEEFEKAQNQIIYLQEKLNDAEEDAQFRAEEMTELIIQIREYEEGVYGLSEARSQVKELKNQLKVRDSQILKLIEQINSLTLQVGGEQIEISEDHLNDAFFQNGDITTDLDLRTQFNAVQKTAINLSMQNFELKTHILKLNADLKKKDNIPVQDDKEAKVQADRLLSVIEENEALRKGLHEVLESIQNHDGTSRIVIESTCLEQLLDALDSRHLAGWYHPGMRLQAELNKMQGTNDALRQELRESRFRESYFQAELQTAMIQLGELENKLRTSDSQMPPTPAPRSQVDLKSQGLANPEEEVEVHQSPEHSPSRISQASQLSRQSSANHPSPDEKISFIPKEVSENEEAKLVRQSSDKTDAAEELQTSKREVLDQSIQTDFKIADVDIGTQTDSDPCTLLYSSDVEEQPVKDTSEPNIGLIKNGIKFKKFEKSPDKEIKIKNDDCKKEKGFQHREEETSVSLNTIEELERSFRKKCDELRAEFENMKDMNQTALLELHKNKDMLFEEVQRTVGKIKDELAKLKEASETKSATAFSEFTLGAFKEQEDRLLTYGIELGELRKGIIDKDTLINSLESDIKELKRKLEDANSHFKNQYDKKFKTFKETIASLQQIIAQKESTNERFKAMIQERNEEYGQLFGKYQKLENSVNKVVSPRDPLSDAKSVSILMAKWIARVHGLEAQIADLKSQLEEATRSLNESKKETEYWRNISERVQEDLTSNEEMQEKMNEMENLKAIVKQLKEEADNGFQNKLKQESLKYKRKEEELQSQLKSMESEIFKLKHQLNIRTSRGTTKVAKRELVLLDRIRTLEEELEKCKTREKYQLQIRKDKCNDEVAKWEEKKRLQTTNEKYKNEIKEKAAQIEILETQISRLKSIIARMERERISLQRRLKAKEGLLTKSLSEGSQDQDYEIKSFGTESHLGDTPVPEITPRNLDLLLNRSQAESAISDVNDPRIKSQSRRDLVKAVTSLKKVISKLRAEHSNYYHKDYVEQLQKELRQMENNYMDAAERALTLEQQLRETETKICRETFTVGGPDDRTELIFLKEQLAQKCDLLGKVKILLQRAILREKQLIQQSLKEYLDKTYKKIYQALRSCGRANKRDAGIQLGDWGGRVHVTKVAQ